MKRNEATGSKQLTSSDAMQAVTDFIPHDGRIVSRLSATGTIQYMKSGDSWQLYSAEATMGDIFFDWSIVKNGGYPTFQHRDGSEITVGVTKRLTDPFATSIDWVMFESAIPSTSPGFFSNVSSIARVATREGRVVGEPKVGASGLATVDFKAEYVFFGSELHPNL